MKKIGIDARLYFQTGVGTYIQNLLHYLQEKNISDITFYVYMMREDCKNVTFNKSFIIRPTDAKWHSFKEQYLFPFQLYKDKLDLMHFTYFSSPLLYRKKFITTIHDITNILYKTGSASTKSGMLYAIKHLVFRIIMVNQVFCAKYIITPTKSVKNELIRYYGKNIQNKITPIYEGVHSELIDSKEKLPSLYPKNYLLYIGNFYPHKNIERLIRAYKNITYPLVLHGPKDFFSKKIQIAVEKENMQETIILDNTYLSPAQLSVLYKHAKALIFPSLSEGFGLPLVEAMKFNIPILASQIPVFEEILQKEYTPFDPTSEDDINKKIKMFLQNPHTYDYKKILPKFSFEKMTNETLVLYRQALTL